MILAAILYFLGGAISLYDAVAIRKIHFNPLEIPIIFLIWPWFVVLYVYGFVIGFIEGRKNR